MRSVKVLLVAALVFGACAVTYADTILVDQTATPWGWQSVKSITLADDFTLTSGATVNAAAVVGQFANDAFGDASLNSFTISVYSNSSNAPGTALATQTVTSGWTVNGSLYSIPLSDINLGAGTYWLGIQASVTPGTTGSGDFSVAWANGDPGGSYTPVGNAAVTVGGNSWSRTSSYHPFWGWSATVYNDNSGAEPLDLAFSLSGTAGAATPEPSSIILVCMGLVGMLAYAWRKRK